MFFKCSPYTHRLDRLHDMAIKLRDAHPDYQFALYRTQDDRWYFVACQPLDLTWLYAR